MSGIIVKHYGSQFSTLTDNSKLADKIEKYRHRTREKKFQISSPSITKFHSACRQVSKQSVKVNRLATENRERSVLPLDGRKKNDTTAFEKFENKHKT